MTKITAKQLKRFNLSIKAGIASPFHVSCNENWNKQSGLPDPEVRKILTKKVWETSGLMQEHLTMKEAKEALEEAQTN